MKKIIFSGILLSALAFSLAFVPAHAQTTTDMTTGTASSTYTTSTTTPANPGLPNTGAGGDAEINIALLTATGAIAVGGVILLTRRALQ